MKTQIDLTLAIATICEYHEGENTIYSKPNAVVAEFLFSNNLNLKMISYLFGDEKVLISFTSKVNISEFSNALTDSLNVYPKVYPETNSIELLETDALKLFKRFIESDECIRIKKHMVTFCGL